MNRSNRSEGAFNQLHRNLVAYVKDKDIDKDGVPNVKDCQPMNPKMQDITVTTRKGKRKYTVKEIAKKATFAVGGTAIGAYKRIKAYQAKAPKRRAAQITKLRQQVKIAQEKKKIRKLKEQAGGVGFMGGVSRYFEGVAAAGGEQGFAPRPGGMKDLGVYAMGQPTTKPKPKAKPIKKVRRKTRKKSKRRKR